MNRPRHAPDECPVCGAPVPPGARSCPECGADERAGWDEEASRTDGLDLPDAAWGDEDGGSGPMRHSRSPTGVSWLWWAAAALLAAALLAWVLGLR